MWVWKCESVKCEVWNTESVKSVNVRNCECVKLWKQDSFKPLELYENVKDWKFKRAKEWKCERVKVWKSESVWKCKTVNSDLNTFSFLLNLYLRLNLILNSGAVLHLHLRWRYFNHHHHHRQYSTAIKCHQYSKFQNALSHLFEAGPSEVAKYALHPGLAMLKEFCRLKVAAAAWTCACIQKLRVSAKVTWCFENASYQPKTDQIL